MVPAVAAASEDSLQSGKYVRLSHSLPPRPLPHLSNVWERGEGERGEVIHQSTGAFQRRYNSRLPDLWGAENNETESTNEDLVP